MTSPARWLPASIRGRLLLLAAAVMIPAMLLAVLLIREAQRSQRTLVERQLSETARALALVMDRQLGQSEVLLKALATSPDLARGNYEAFYAQAKSLVPEDDRWVVLTTAEGQQLVNTHVPWGTPLPKNNLKPLDYAPGLTQGRTHISNLIPSMVQREQVVSVVIPILAEGRLTHALVLVKKPSRLNSVLFDQRLPADWIAAIIDGDGMVVARTRGHDEFFGKPATPDVRAAVKLRESGVIESRSLDGVATLAAFSRTPNISWSIIVGAPRSEVENAGGRLVLLAALVSFLLVAIGVAMSASVARSIVLAVEQLVHGAQRLGHGQEPQAVATGMRETDEVAVALETSALQLRTRESELRRLNETLEARVQERTAELAEANRVLSIRNRELQDFAQIASHDLQEPARRISVFSDLIKTECDAHLSETGRFYVERMQVAAHRLSQLISDMLAFSAVTMHIRPRQRVDLNQTLTNVLADLEVRLAETGGDVDAGSLIPVEADAAQTHHVLLNLVGNALKFHRPGVPPRVRVETVAEGDMVRIAVEDNGVGFDPKYAPRIFAPFQRLHGRDVYDGTGIGLAIVRRIVERHGGAVSATSIPGVGSRFEVTLPAASSSRGKSVTE